MIRDILFFLLSINMVNNIGRSHVLNVTNTLRVACFFSDGNCNQAKIILLHIKLEDKTEVE